MTMYATGEVPAQEFGLSNDWMMDPGIQDVADHPANALPMARPKSKSKMNRPKSG